MRPVRLHPKLRLDTIENRIDGMAVRLHSDRVNAGIGPLATSHVHQLVVDPALFVVNDIGAAVFGEAQAFRNAIYRYDTSGSQHEGRTDREMSDRPRPPNCNGVPFV